MTFSFGYLCCRCFWFFCGHSERLTPELYGCPTAGEPSESLCWTRVRLEKWPSSQECMRKTSFWSKTTKSCFWETGPHFGVCSEYNETALHLSASHMLETAFTWAVMKIEECAGADSVRAIACLLHQKKITIWAKLAVVSLISRTWMEKWSSWSYHVSIRVYFRSVLVGETPWYFYTWK